MVGVGDRQRRGQRLRLLAVVLDFEEDAEVGGSRRRRLLVDQVGRVLGVVRVQVAREGDVEGELAELDRLALDNLGLVALVAAGGDAQREGGKGQSGKQRQDESATRGHRRRESIRTGLRDAGRVAVAPGDGDGLALPGLRLEPLAEPAHRLAPAALLPDGGRREDLQGAVDRPRLGPVGHPHRGQRARPLGQLPDRVAGDAVGAAAAAALDDQVGLLDPDDRRVHPGRAQRRCDPEPGAGADSLRLDPGQVEAGEEMVGEARPEGEVAEGLEDALARDVDLGFGADGTHPARFYSPPGRGPHHRN